jgi:hypothetical protein
MFAFYSPIVKAGTPMERRAQARHASKAWGFPAIASAWSDPTSKRSIGRSFFGHHRISLRVVAMVAPGVAGVYWATESHALTFQRGSR